MNMRRQPMAKTTADFVSTDGKLDGLEGRLAQNEVRIAQIEEKMDGRESYMVNRFDHHDEHAKERLQQQDQHIMSMGQEHKTYHKTYHKMVLARLEDFGKAQAAMQEQIGEQRKQHEEETILTDRKIAELERRLKEAKEAAEARAHTQAGAGEPGEMTLRIAGFQRDTPADDIEEAARKYMSLATAGEQQMNDVAASP